MAITISIPVLPDAPSRADPASFNTRADNFLAVMETLPTSINTWANQANSLASDLTAEGDAAAAAKTAAEAAQAAATATAGASVYSAGTTYSYPQVVIGSDGHSYRRIGSPAAGDNPVGSGTGGWLRITSGVAGAWQAKSANFTAQSGGQYTVNTTAGVVSVTLPSSPPDGDRIVLLDPTGSWSTNKLTVVRGSVSHKIMGLAEDMTCSTANDGFSLIYFAATTDWRFSV